MQPALTASFLLCATLASAQTAQPPRFEDYKVREIFKGSPAPPRLVSPEARMYRTAIRQAVVGPDGVFHADTGAFGPGPNFAGHYFVVGVMCGAPCAVEFIVDATTGEVYPPPKAEGNTGIQRHILPPGGPIQQSPSYRVDSKLYRINACEGSACFTYSYLWDQATWKLLYRAKLAPAPK